MKKLLLVLFTALMFISCQTTEKKLIKDHEQTLGDTKIDTDISFNSLDEVQVITAKDSLKILETYLEEKRVNKIEELSEMIELYQDYVDKYTIEVDEAEYQSMKDIYQELLDLKKESIESYKLALINYQGDCKDTFLEPVIAQIEDYKKRGDEVLFSKYKANFTANNPFLNNIKQEITREYYISADKTKIMTVRND